LTSPFLEVNESGGAGWRDWVSSGFNDGAAAGELTSFVHCRDPKVTRVRARVNATTPAPVGEFVTATAKCGRREKVVFGGFANSPIDTVGNTPVLYISESRRASKRAWEVSAHSNGNELGHLTAIAYCIQDKKPKVQSASATVGSDPPATETAEILARCKPKQRVVSGGFGSTDDSGEATPRVLTSRREGKRGWAVTAFVGSNGLPVEVTTYAYCEKKKTK
jgi:hypothetical protein